MLAAAVCGEADAIVTFNLKDFPEEAAARHGIEIVHPATFLLRLLEERGDTMVATVQREIAAFRNPPETVAQFLATLTATVPTFANLAADAFSERPGPHSSVPALVRADEEEAIAAFGRPGDLPDPAQVGLAWWSGRLNDLDLARELTHHPPAWGDYQWAINHLAGRSLASKVIRGVDAPDKVAFMRFFPEVSAAAQAFQTFLSTATILTLVEIGDGTWRVWGLGPAILSASDILNA